MKISDIIKATGGKLLSGNENTEFSCIERDSRMAKENMLFIALKGDSFDGNDFAEAAVGNGAVGCIVSREMNLNSNVVLVDDTRKALRDIAKYYRQKFDVPFVGVTGSVGKTTTKDMIACALSAKYNVLKTQGNFNNEIGLPLTVFGLDNTHDIGVAEMGMSGFGEIDRLADIVKPDCGVFTNIGLSHVEKLGSRENILKAKAEMIKHIGKDGLVVLCGDDDMLWSIKDKIEHKHIYYGIENNKCDVLATNIKHIDDNKTSFDIVYDGKKYKTVIPVLGEHNVKNALASFCVAIHYNITPEQVIDVLKDFVPGKMRQNILRVNGITIINDCYNASPSSVEAGLKILNQIESAGRKIAVLGDMLEMGDLSETAHKTVGRYVVNNNVDFLVTIGEKSSYVAIGATENGFDKNHIMSFRNNSDAEKFLDELIKKGDIVLFKASRAMKLEELVDHIVGF